MPLEDFPTLTQSPTAFSVTLFSLMVSNNEGFCYCRCRFCFFSHIPGKGSLTETHPQSMVGVFCVLIGYSTSSSWFVFDVVGFFVVCLLIFTFSTWFGLLLNFESYLYTVLTNPLFNPLFIIFSSRLYLPL